MGMQVLLALSKFLSLVLGEHSKNDSMQLPPSTATAIEQLFQLVSFYRLQKCSVWNAVIILKTTAL